MSNSPSSSSALRLARAAESEIARAMKQMRIPRQKRPYYISFLIRDEEDWRLKAKYGTLIADSHERRRNAFCDVRVGTYKNDQVRDGGLEDNDKDAESYGYVDLPFGEKMDGVRHGLWRLADARYREAVEALLYKRSHEVTYVDPNRHLQSFERRDRVVDMDYTPFPRVDRAAWARFVERASTLVKTSPGIKDSSVEFQAEHTCRVFVSSEGSTQIHCQPIWAIDCYLWLLSEKGDPFPWTLRHMVTDPSELPDVEEFRRQIRQAAGRLRLLARAPTLRSFSGPALLDPIPAGLLMHEAVGHRLEGSRLLASGEGQTFKDSLGAQILPEFLSIRDDPSLRRFNGRTLVGHYRYDDEGVAAQNVKLVDRGKLTGFMTTRVGVARRHHSTGHARAQYHQRPISRMGVMIVDSENGLGPKELKQALIEEIRRQKAAFGVRIAEASSGETATDAYNFQAFLGEAGLVSKVYPDGREELIRGVNFVGTPLNAIRNIIAAGRQLEVDNAFCGAESGYVPVSTISPALLVSELELQAKPEAPYTPYTFPIPWDD